MLWKIIITSMTSQKLLIIQCALFLLLNILDGYTTWLVMKPNHYERERNPIARWVFRKLKLPNSIVLFKAFLLSWLGVFIAYWWREALTINLALLIGNLLYVVVVLHNLKTYKKYDALTKSIEQVYHYSEIIE